MGHCLITRRGGGGTTSSTNLPTLNAAYPQDIEIWGGEDSATFEVKIANGVSNLTYEWYKDGELVGSAAKYTETKPNDYGLHTIQCMVRVAGGAVPSRIAAYNVKNPNFVFTYTGESEKANTNGTLYYLLSSGNLTISNYGKNTNGLFDIFLLGGGAGGALYGVGGGGYYTTLANQTLIRKATYPVIIGGGGTAGGDSSAGGAGGSTIMLEQTAEGGKKGVRINKAISCSCVSNAGSGGNLYSFQISGGKFVNRTSLGQGYHTLNLRYPITQHTALYGSSNITYYQAATGNTWYLCAISSYGDISYAGTVTAGDGGEATTLFGDATLIAVSGPGVIESTEALNYGQGGNDVNLEGANGLVALRLIKEG